MDNNSNNEENNEEVEIKMGFFKKLWYSITKIEKYPEMSAQGLGKALSYVARLVILLSIVLCIWLVIEAYGVLKSGLDYLQNEFPDFSYKDGILTVESQEPIIIGDENSSVGKVIVDTNTESQEQINQYENSIGEENSGIIILKDKLLIKNMSVANSIEYNYEQTFKDMNITEFDKQTIIEYCSGTQMYYIFGGMYLTLLVYIFIMYFISTLWYIAIISIVRIFDIMDFKNKNEICSNI